jgi:dTDP-4-amino-4,6-dideoxygalactose transaminase
MNSVIPFNVPYLAKNSESYLLRSLRSGKFSGDGPATERATKLLSAMFNDAGILLTPSCTHALEMAVRLLSIQPGDEIIVPSYTFTSTANAIVLAGGVPVFVDIEPLTQNIDPAIVADAITSRTRAVFCINYGGVSSFLKEMKNICDENNLVLLEDNAHGLGGMVDNQPLGTFGALATQSFHETKNVQCGEGGCLVINDVSFQEQAEILREKGTNRSKFFRGQVDKYSWVSEGSSWLLADTLAAFLESQLVEFEEIQKSRSNTWNYYSKELARFTRHLGIQQMHIPSNCQQTFHMYYLMLDSLEQRTALIKHLQKLDIQAAFHYQPLHSSDAGMKYGRIHGEFQNTIRASDCLVRLPLWAGMSQETIERVVAGVTSFEA